MTNFIAVDFHRKLGRFGRKFSNDSLLPYFPKKRSDQLSRAAIMSLATLVCKSASGRLSLPLPVVERHRPERNVREYSVKWIGLVTRWNIACSTIFLSFLIVFPFGDDFVLVRNTVYKALVSATSSFSTPLHRFPSAPSP